jgi:hypothetical protein
MKKYDVRFCDCGRVLFIEQDKIDHAIENEKEVLVVCNHCGDSFVIGANKEINPYSEDGKECYMMYSYEMKNTIETNMNRFDSIVFTRGEMIRMETGGEATYHGQGFIDWDTKKPDDITEEEWDKKRRTVNTQHTINWIHDDDKIEAMSHYGVDIHWAGTRFEHDYNK